MAATIWNASDMTAGMSLASGNLEIICAAGGSHGVRSNNFKTAGKWYFEYPIIAALSGGGTGLGIGILAAGLTTVGSAAADAAIWFDGQVYVNGSGSAVTVNGATLQIALDLDNALIWFRTAGGNWNGNATYNPATKVGGLDISGFVTADTTAVYAMACSNSNIDVTAAFLASGFSYTAPAGFSAWDAAAAPSSSNWWFWL